METITYLVANYNCSKYIKECIESLKKQTNDRWVCIICDDASTDNSIDVITSCLNQNIKLIKNKVNLGYIETLKRLIQEAETDIVGFLDGDDALFPEATEAMLSIYDKNRKAEFVHARLQLFDETLTFSKGTLGREIKPGKTSLKSGFITKLFTFRKSAYYRTEGLNKEALYAEDRDLILKLEEVTFPFFLNKILYKYRVIPGSQSHDFKRREIGLVNYVKAKKEALRRRKIKGLDKIMHELIMNLDYIEWSNRFSKFTIWIAINCRRILWELDMRLKIRSNGILRRF